MITTNRGGRLTYMSQAAQALTGWLQQDAMGAELTTMLSFEEDGPVQVIENPAMQAMMECRIVRFDRVTLRAKDGTTRPVAGSTAPVIDDAGVVIGSVVVFHDAQALEQPDRGFESIRSELRQAVARAPGVINLCAWCKRVPDVSGNGTTWTRLSRNTPACSSMAGSVRRACRSASRIRSQSAGM